MTAPFRYHDYEAELGPSSPVAEQEWQQFLRRRQELMSQIMSQAGQISGADSLHQAMLGQGGGPPQLGGQHTLGLLALPPAPTIDPNKRTAQRDELLAQADFWGIPDAEHMDLAQLALEIEQRRQEVPRDERTSAGSIAAGLVGGAAAVGGGLVRGVGNMLGLPAMGEEPGAIAATGGLSAIPELAQRIVTHFASKLPFAGEAMKRISDPAEAQRWLYDVSKRSEWVIEAARAAQPASRLDQTITDLLTAGGRVTGSLIPAFAAWEVVGAAGLAPALGPAGIARGAAPIARAAIQGLASSTLLEAGADEEAGTKALNIGIGTGLGALAGVAGPLGAAVGTGLIGAGFGGQVGQSAAERTRNAIIGGVLGAALPFTRAGLGAAGEKLSTSFRTPWNNHLLDAAQEQRALPPGPTPPPPVGLFPSGEPIPQAGIPQLRALTSGEGPGGQPMPQELGQLPGQPGPAGLLGPGSEPPGLGYYPMPPVPTEPPPAPPALGAGLQVRGLLPETTTPSRNVQAAIRSIDSLRGTLANWQERAAYEEQTQGSVSPDTQAGIADVQALVDRAESFVSVARQEDRERANRFRINPPVSSGPLSGSLVANPDGTPRTVYHGTRYSYDQWDPSTDTGDNKFGPGYYTTESPAVASTPGYTGLDEMADNVNEIDFFQERLADAQAVKKGGATQFDGTDIDSYISHAQQLLDQAVGRHASPNVRPMRLMIQRPFDISKPWTHEEFYALLDRLDAAEPGFDWQSLRPFAEQTAPKDLTGERIYKSLSNTPRKMLESGYAEDVLSPLQPELMQRLRLGAGQYVGEPSIVGKDGVNYLLQGLGHDGITHIGGDLYSGEHRVWIAFKPEQIHLPWDAAPLDVQAASETASGMNKQATILEGPTVPEAVGKARLGDADVVQAALAQNPAGVSVIRGVADPLSILGAPSRPVIHGTDAPTVVFGNRPAYFATDPTDVFVTSRQNSVQARISSRNPLTLSVARQRLPEIATAFDAAGVPADLAQETLGFIQHNDPSAFFSVSPEVAAAYKSLGYDAIHVDEGLRSDWWIALSKEQITAPDVRFVQREGRLDALVGEVSDAQAAEYEKHGLFTGQRVVTAQGVEGVVMSPANKRGLVVVKRGSGPPLTVRPERVLPSRYGAPTREAPDLWNSFKAYALSSLNDEAVQAGMKPIEDQFDPRVVSSLHSRMRDYFDAMGMDAGERQVLEDYFNSRWVDEIRDLDPETRDWQSAQVDEATKLANAAEGTSEEIPVPLEELAEKRGFIWITAPGEGGTLRDGALPGPSEMPFATDEAAQEFLRGVDRALPDHTPTSEVPLEVAEVLPSGTALEPVRHFDTAVESLDNVVEMIEGQDFDFLPPDETPVVTALPPATEAGAGGLPPGSPPPPPILPPGQYEMPPVPPRPQPPDTIGRQFRRLYRRNPERYKQMEDRLTGWLTTKLRYTRYAMLGIERRLTNAGLDMGRAWQHYEDLATARSKASNEALPWLNRLGEVTRQFPRRIMRDGTVTRIHEITDTNARMAAWWRLKQSHGFDDGTVKQIIKADDQLTSFFHDWFTNLVGDPAYSMTAEREIFRYVPHVRARQATGVDAPYASDFLSPVTQYFAEFAREGNLQFRVMDIRDLGAYTVRAGLFKKYESVPWQNFVDAWQDDRVPEGLRNYMMDYAKLQRFGYDPKGELAVRGVKRVMSSLGLDLTSREAAHLLNTPAGLQYIAMLGGRTSIFFRDAIQPILATAKIRVPELAGVYRDVLKGAGKSLTEGDAAVLGEMYNRGIKAGWIERENPNLEGLGMWEDVGNQGQGELQDADALRRFVVESTHKLGGQTGAEASATRGEIANAQQQLSRLATREDLAQLGDIIHDAQLPAWLVRPTESNINTLKWYGRQGQLHRLIVGEAGYRQATSAIAAYRKSILEAAMAGKPELAMTWDKLADGAFFSSFEAPIHARLRELVESGADDEAAQLFGREVANWSQFRYGRKEMPEAVRGSLGRMAYMLGSFSGQFLEGANSALRGGSSNTPGQNFRFGARYGMVVGGVSAALWAAKQATGWGFDKWTWNPFEFTGSPMLHSAMVGAGAALGLAEQAMGKPRGEMEAGAERDVWSPGGGAADYFPGRGYVQTAAELYDATQGLNPLGQATRYLVTGDRGSRADIQPTGLERWIEERARSQRQPPFQPFIPQGSLSPAGGQMPGRPQGGGYSIEPAHPNPGGGAQ